MTTRVGIVDDHPTIVLGVTAIVNLQHDLHVVAAASTVAGLLADERRIDVVLLDLVLADGSTPQRNIKKLTAAGIRALAYTAGERPTLVQQAARAGAMGMIRKSSAPEDLSDAIRIAARGETVASADWAAALDEDTVFVGAELTAREAEVLALYASGATAEMVAHRLVISKLTVIDHVRRIRAKYAAAARPARTKQDLYRRAIEDGIVPPPA